MLNLLNKKVLLLVVGLALCQFSWAQQEDNFYVLDSSLVDFPAIESFQSKSTLDPNKAALYSAIIPGLGQVYNKQYWKLPIIYGGAIVIGHYIKVNHDFFNAFRNAYLAETDGDDTTINKFATSGFSATRLQVNAERFKRDRDFLIIIGVLYYVLNIVDAHVAAHLSEFDINDNLSVTPSYQQNSQFTTRSMGLSLRLNLSK